MSVSNIIEFKDKVLLEKAKKQAVWYFILDPQTNCPYVHDGMADLFVSPAVVSQVIKGDPIHYQKPMTIKEYRPDKKDATAGLDIFAWFYYLGLEKIKIFYDDAFGVVDRAEFMPHKDLSDMAPDERPVENPALRLLLSEFLGTARWDRQYEGKLEYLQKKEEEVFKELTKARFLAPVQQVEDGENLGFAKVSNGGREYLPLFTDFSEFSKTYPMNQWKGLVITLAEALDIAKEDAPVINFTAEAMVINKDLAERIFKG